VSEQKPSVDHALDLFLYAPLGLALYARDTLPGLVGVFVARGRREIDVQRNAVPDVRLFVEEGLGRAREAAEGALHAVMTLTGHGGAEPGSPDPSTAPSATVGGTSTPTATTTVGATVKPVDETVTVAALPIPEYDELSASQVVERLEGLGRDDLEAVRCYEVAHRGRNTILGKIAQLTR
jgi:hypothetical protein